MDREKLRIAEYTDSFLPIVDGVGRVVFNYAKWLAQRGHECYVMCPQGDTGFRGNFRFEIVDYAGISLPVSPQYKTGVPALDNHYTKRVDMLSFDLIHAHTPGFAGMEAVRIAKKRALPLVGTFHSKYYDDFYKVTKSKMIASIGASMVADFYDHCDEVWTVSENAAETLRGYGYKGDIQIVRNGSEAKKIQFAPQAEVESFLAIADEPVFLYVGQIDEKKNLSKIVKACAMLKGCGADFRMVFVGQGKDANKLKRLSEKLGVQEKLLFTGHISDPKLLCGIYKRAGLFVFPSLYDTAGLVVSEAASMGTPSLVLEGSAPAEIIVDGVNGIYCKNTAESLFAKMHKALEAPNQLAELGEAAKKSIPVFWDSILPFAGERYFEMIKRKKG